jgi:anthranilate synthase component 2
MILIIDNYDSFTYNLYQFAGAVNPDITVVRNDKIDIDGIRKLAPTHIIVSPGPGYPADAGVSIEVIRRLGPEIPLLGICLGHQAIGEAFGGKVVLAPSGPVHGKTAEVHIASGCPVFRGLPPVIKAGRYHSLVVERAGLPEALSVTAETTDGTIMGMAHKTHPVFGIQFHPESILTERGMEIIRNFLGIPPLGKEVYPAECVPPSQGGQETAAANFK